jgi:hypothetical protein
MRVDGRYGYGPLAERAILVGVDLDVFKVIGLAMLPFLLPLMIPRGD